MLDDRAQVTLDFAVGCGLLVMVTIVGFQVSSMVLSPDATAEYQSENYITARMLARALATSQGEPVDWNVDNVIWPGLSDARFVLNLTKMSMLLQLHDRLGPMGLAELMGLNNDNNQYFYSVSINGRGVILLSIGYDYDGEPGMGRAQCPVAILNHDASEVYLGNLIVQVWREWVGRDDGG